MLMLLLEGVCVLALLVVGLLIMTQAIDFERLWQGLSRAVSVIVAGILGCWLFKTALLPIFICVLVWLKHAMGWMLVVLFGIIAVALVLWYATRKSSTVTTRRNHEKEAQ